MKRRHLAAAAIAAACIAGLPATASAQSGQKPLRVLVPYGPGTGADVTARMIAERLTTRTGTPVIVENRPGNSAVIGVNALKNAPPDGGTIGVLVSANAAQPWLVKDLPFDIRNDFEPITVMYSGPLVLTVPTSLPVNTLAEFVQYAKANPGKVFFGTLGPGTTTDIAAHQLAQAAGLQITTVPYKGSSEIHTAVASGQVTASFDNYVSPKPLVDAGRLKALATTAEKRTANLPQVPALAETYPGVELRFWTGFAAPRGTPREVLARLGAELRAVMQLPEVRERIEKSGSEAGGGSAEDFGAMIRRDYDNFGRAIRAANIKPQ